jgi:hypothetical protein
MAGVSPEGLLVGPATSQILKPHSEMTGGTWRGWALEALVLGLALFGVWHVARRLPSRAVSNDFAHYYISSRLLLTGADVYSTRLQPQYDHWGFHYTHAIPTATNPPLLVEIFVPFAMLPPRAAFWAWTALEVLSLGSMLVLTWRLTASRLSARTRRLLCAGIIASAPVYWHFFFSQCQLLLGAMILIAYACLRNGRPTSACLAITTAMWLKLFPVMLVPWFLWRAGPDWKTRMRCAGAALVWSAGLIVASGVDEWRQFWLHGMKVLKAWAEWQRHFNFTVPSFVKNAVWALHNFNPEWNGLHTWAEAGAIAGVALIALTYGVTWWKAREQKQADVECEFCLLSIAMIAGIAEGWGHYFVMLAFPATVAVARVAVRPTTGRVVVLGLSLVMLNVMGDLRSPWLDFAVGYIPLYGLLLLGAFFVNEVLGSNSRTVNVTTFALPPQ